MSVRDEDRNKNCPSRGLGIAAAAIGVGVGAALYYFFSKRPENPADEGATSSGWAEQPHILQHDHDSSYTTISEHSTTDTSIIDISDSSEFTEDSWLPSPNFNILQTLKRRIWNSYLSSNDTDDESLDTNDDSAMEEYSFSSTVDSSTEFETLNASSDSYDVGSDLDTNTEWDVTSSSLGIPEDVQGLMSQIFVNTSEMFNLILNSSGSCVNRERSWSLEECSICFEVMLKDQEVLALECTHRFHQACIMPWLQQQQTCPNCRKAS